MLKITVPIIGVAVAVVLLLAATMLGRMWWGSPPSVLGFSVLNLAEGPEQPIAFPHTVHVQDAGLDCQFCHRTVTSEETAGIPAVEQCLFCHDLGRIDGSKFDASGNKIPGTQSPEIEKIRNAFYGNPETGDGPSPINWVRVHRLPDHVQFVHYPHLQAGLTCSTCHGDVGSMVKVKQVRDLKMSDCVDCHRDNNAPTDCATCHY
mgnify:CR=1 FL=1